MRIFQILPCIFFRTAEYAMHFRPCITSLRKRIATISINIRGSIIMKRTKILIVEDDKNTLNGLVEILGQEGYDVTGAESAAAALQILHAHRFEIMLTDLRLPDMSGMELYQQVRHTCRHMQTVVMTAYSASHEAREAAQADIFELLEKPARPGALVSHA